MNRISGTFAVIAMAVAGVAAAQTTPQSTPPSDTMPSSQYPASPSSSSSQSTEDLSSARAEKRVQMKDCLAQQKANNPGMSKHDMKRACKNQLSGSSPQG